MWEILTLIKIPEGPRVARTSVNHIQRNHYHQNHNGGPSECLRCVRLKKISPAGSFNKSRRQALDFTAFYGFKIPHVREKCRLMAIKYL